MKRKICFLLVFLLAFSFNICGVNANEGDNGDSVPAYKNFDVSISTVTYLKI